MEWPDGEGHLACPHAIQPDPALCLCSATGVEAAPSTSGCCRVEAGVPWEGRRVLAVSMGTMMCSRKGKNFYLWFPNVAQALRGEGEKGMSAAHL